AAFRLDRPASFSSNSTSLNGSERTISKATRMSTAKQLIAIVVSTMLLLIGCANQGGDQVRSVTSTTGDASEPRPSTTMPWGNNNLGTPPMLPTSTATGR